MNGPQPAGGRPRGGLGSLRRIVAGLPRAAVAVSGGVDSMTLAFLAGRWLGPRAEMFHAVSPAVPAAATRRVQAHAARHGWRLRVIDAGEFADPAYLSNPANRCYFCKRNLYGTIAGRTGAQLLSGANLDDLGDVRPGLTAAAEARVRHPYVEAGIGKPAIRAIARRFGLSDLHDLPAAPCLASRLETGLAVTAARLGFIAAAEEVLRRRFPGGRSLRCRLRAGGIELQLDAALLAKLEETQSAALRNEIAGLQAAHGLALPVRIAAYVRGSAFLFDEAVSESPSPWPSPRRGEGRGEGARPADGIDAR